MALVPDATDDVPPSADRLPTLTEVVQLGARDAEVPPAPEPGQAGGAAPPSAPDANALVDEVLAELAPRIDMLMQSRLREVLAPALARAADGLIRDAREGLATTLHELVEEAVARALKRRAGR